MGEQGCLVTSTVTFFIGLAGTLKEVGFLLTLEVGRGGIGFALAAFFSSSDFPSGEELLRGG